MFVAIRVLKEQQIPHGEIQFVITVGEESGLIGARAMDGSKLRAKLGFALDSNGEIGATTRSRVMVTVRPSPWSSGSTARAMMRPSRSPAGVDCCHVLGSRTLIAPLTIGVPSSTRIARRRS